MLFCANNKIRFQFLLTCLGRRIIHRTATRQVKMRDFRNEIIAFRQDKLAELADARQRAALQLCCGIELADALSGGLASAHSVLRRLERAIERERLKGVNRHWSYDLNRHIALKQVRDRLKGVSPAEPARLTYRPRHRRRKSKAAPEGAAH
ncbi:hypothetical protein PV773_02410 [Mesorhizobium sp. CC13]|uniref:hypothetical protein n=1 Tax=Mesorhizobium sp. CC13 TaxID=3029194 RepID=UPI003264065F